MKPLSRSPLPPVARPGLPGGHGVAALTVTRDDGGHALEQDGRHRRRARPPPRRVQGSSSMAPRRARGRACGTHRDAASAPPAATAAVARAASSRPAKATRASASITTALGPAATAAARRSARPRRATQPGADHHRIRPLEQCQQLGGERRSRADARSVCRSGSAAMSAATVAAGATAWTSPAPAAKAAREARRDGARSCRHRHRSRPPVRGCPCDREPRRRGSHTGGELVGHQQGPVAWGSGMTDVDHDHVARPRPGPAGGRAGDRRR